MKQKSKCSTRIDFPVNFKETNISLWLARFYVTRTRNPGKNVLYEQSSQQIKNRNVPNFHNQYLNFFKAISMGEIGTRWSVIFSFFVLFLWWRVFPTRQFCTCKSPNKDIPDGDTHVKILTLIMSSQARTRTGYRASHWLYGMSKSHSKHRTVILDLWVHTRIVGKLFAPLVNTAIPETSATVRRFQTSSPDVARLGWNHIWVLTLVGIGLKWGWDCMICAVSMWAAV